VKGKVSGIGVILLLVAMAIVLYLTAQAWNAMAPAALDVSSAANADDRGALDEMPEDERGRLPGLKEMQDTTREHNEQVDEALKQID
jgi:hypothetical protein